MKKRGKIFRSILMFLFVFGIAFFASTTKAYALHHLEFKFYDCDSVNESKLTDVLDDRNRVQTAASVECYGPNGDGVTPEITASTVAGVGSVYKVEPGKVIKVGVYYEPQLDNLQTGIGVKFTFDLNSLDQIKFTKYLSRNWVARPAYSEGEDYTRWYASDYTLTVGNQTDTGRVTMAAMGNSGSQSIELEDDMVVAYYYFKVKDDAPTNTVIPFNYDTSPSGVSFTTEDARYTVTDADAYVEVPLSDDNTLGSLSVKNGSTTYPLTPAFTPGSTTVDSYTAYIPNNITSVDIEATPNDDKAILMGDGTKNNLSVGNNSNTITVTSESGIPKEYTVNVYRLNNDADLSALSLTNVDFGTFNSATTSYTATVPYTTTSTTVSATAHDADKATVSGTGNKNLSVGSNTISVEVTPENCKSEYSSVPGNTCTKKTYTVTVTREDASEDATLSDLKVDGVQVPGFDPDTYTYTLDAVPNNKTSVNITYETTDTNATVTGDGTQSLSVGNNALEVVVTAQDGTTKKTYTINIKRKSDDNTLSSLTVTSDPAGTLSPAFDPSKTSYTYSVEANEDAVVIAAVANQEGATVTGTGTYNPRTTSSVTVTVTPEDGTPKDYVITFDVAKSDNANLSDLGVTGYSISPAFDEDTLTYTLTVPSDVDKATITATLADDRASKTGDGEQNLDYGENSFPVVVTAEDGTTKKTYTVKITREKKTDATLSDLKVDGVQVPGFDPDTYSYTLPAVATNKTSVNITYETTDGDATVTGDGTQNLAIGDNALEVVVTAQDGTTKKTYTINIHRNSDDNELKTLSVTSDPAGTLSPTFNPNTLEYTYTTDPDETEVVISGTVGEGATLVGDGTYNPATTSKVDLIVTSENGTPKTYTINLVRAESSNKDLSDLGVTGYTISPAFNPSTTAYTLTVPSDESEVEVTATKGDERQTISGTGTQNLGYGENTITVTVEAEDGTTKDYVITITREMKTDSSLGNLTVDGVQVPGFDPDVHSYTLDPVENDKATIVIGYELGDSDASATGEGTKNLLVGDNSFDVVVTSQDGNHQTTYTINVRRKNDNSDLLTLSVTSSKGGTLSPDFNAGTLNYIYTTDPDETEVTISGTVGEGATLEGTGTYDPNTTSEVEVIVTSENGTKKTYTITLEKAKSTNANLSDLEVEGYTITPSFDKDVTEYTLTVPSDVDSIKIDTELEDDRATVSGDGNRGLDYGTNEITVTVTAEDGVTTKPYTIRVTRERKTDANLLSIKVDNVAIPGFDPDTLSYTLDDVANDKNSVNIVVETSDEDATVSGDGNRELIVGDNALEVTVTAQDGTTTKKYVINIHRNNNDSSLKSLTVTSNPAGTLSPAFDPDVTDYTFVVDRDTTEVVVAAEANGEGADISGTGTYDPQTDDTIEVLVTSEDGTTTLYTITIEKSKSDNADLESLEVEGYDITPAFDKDETSYTLTVPSDVDSIKINATADDDGYATVEGTGTKDLEYGSNSFSVVVTAEDGTTTKTYTVTVTRELSDDVKLSDLTIDGDTIEGFDPDVPSYTIEVGNDVTSVTIGAEAQDDNADVNGTGTKDLNVGENTFTIEVVAQDGTTGYYTVTVNRAADDDNTLKSLEVEGYDITPAFDPDETEYTLTVPSDVDSVNIIASPNSDEADVDGDGTVSLNPGDNTIEVTVTAEDGTPKTYTIVITREIDDDEKITSVVYGHDIDDDYILTGNLNATGLNMKDELDNDNEKLVVVDLEQNAITDADYIGTGYEVRLIIGGVQKDQKLIVIKGELNGDTEITLLDAVTACYHYIGSNNPSSGKPTVDGYKVKAADINDDGEITLMDAVSIVYHYVKKVPIEYKTNYTRVEEGD